MPYCLRTEVIPWAATSRTRRTFLAATATGYSDYDRVPRRRGRANCSILPGTLLRPVRLINCH